MKPVCAQVGLLLAVLLSMTHGQDAWASSGAAMDPAVIAAEKDIGAESPSGERGVRLGDFSIRIYYPTEARKSAIGFVCFATVRETNIARFRELFVHRRHKIRDQIIIATRRVPLADYDDPQLVAFRRRLLLRLRRMLPELAIEDIYISDFRLKVENT